MLDKLTKAASELESVAALIDEAHDTIERLTPSLAHQAVIDFVADCAETLDMNADVIWGVILDDMKKILAQHKEPIPIQRTVYERAQAIFLHQCNEGWKCQADPEIHQFTIINLKNKHGFTQAFIDAVAEYLKI